MFKNILFFLLFLTSFSLANEKVILQLKWYHQFQFAGYYAAKEKGFYRELGLDVEIRERDLKFNNVEQVINGNAHYGVADSVLLKYKVQKKPIVIISPIFQHSPSILLSSKDNIQSPYKLDNKNILFYSNDTDGFSILSMIKKLNVNPKFIKDREKNDYIKLINGEVDLMAGYLSNEPFYLKEKGIEPNIIYPANYGFDLYGDMLFTNEYEATNFPKRVERFKEATLKGWDYALNNKEEMIQIIHEKYNKQKSLEHLRYEADVIEKLITRDIIPLGQIDEGRLEYISNLYKEFDKTSSSFQTEDFIFKAKSKNIVLSNTEKAFFTKKNVFKVSNELDWAPFDFSTNGNPKGFSIDLLNLLAKKLNIKFEYVNGYSWNELVGLFKNKELDLLHSLAITQERKKMGVFSQPYFRYQTHFVTRKTNPTINSLEEIKNKVIVVGKNWAIETFLKTNYPKIKLLSVQTLEEMLDAVASGKAYAAILNKNVANYFIKKNNFTNLEVSNWCKEFDNNKARMLHMLAQKEAPELISALNKALNSLTLGELNELNRKWFGEIKDNKNELTLKESLFLEKKPVIRFRVSSKRPPFEFEKNGEPVGIALDYVQKSAKNMGLVAEFVLDDTPILDAYNIMSTNRDAFDTLMFSVKNKSRAERFSFGDAFLSYPMMIITNKNNVFVSSMSDLNNKTVVLEKGYLTNKWIKRDYPTIKIINVDDTLAALKMVNDNKVDAYVGNTAVANYMSVFGDLDKIKVSASSGYGDIEFSFIAPKEWPELASILSKGYQKISPSEHLAIQQKWFSIQTVDKTNYELIGKILFVVVLILIWFLWWNRKLVIEKNKTKEALKELEISQKEQLEQQHIILSQSKVAALGEMIGNIAHQWRQPLSVISTAASGMKLFKDTGSLDDETLNKNIEIIMKNTNYLSETINTFRSYISDEKKIITVNLQSILDKAVHLTIDTLKSHHISIDKKYIASEEILYKLVEGELLQVIINIIKNAQDVFLERKVSNPIITVDLKIVNDSILIVIEDNAGGIPQEVLPKIFDPYFTTKHKSLGTGLGLHMSYKIVTESLMGTISANNIKDGASFIIMLPMDKRVI